jgi:hypothetical protein
MSGIRYGMKLLTVVMSEVPCRTLLDDAGVERDRVWDDARPLPGEDHQCISGPDTWPGWK